MAARKVIYKITYPNGKIYIGKDSTDNVRYFGSANPELIARDFTQSERDNFTITKKVIWQSSTATDIELSQEEMRLIREYESHNPEKGYNRNPPWNG